MLSCVPISNKMETTITNPKLVSNCCVNKLVLFRKPGPIAEVAIKNAAPNIAPFVLALFI
jgi:hypothetical protein